MREGVMSAEVLADAVLGLRDDPQTLAAFVGYVVSADVMGLPGSQVAGTASIMLQGSDSPIRMPCAGAFQSEVVAAAQSGRKLTGKTVLVLVVNSQPVVLTTMGVGG